MLLKSKRFYSNDESTASTLSVDGEHFCFIIEDEHREKKVAGETRIPMGRYKLALKKALTPLTKAYRDRFGWFEWHIELQDVNGFDNVYIHVGNFESDTDACLLANDGVAIKRDANGKQLNAVGSSSVSAYKALYKKVVTAIKNGEDVYIEIYNE